MVTRPQSKIFHDHTSFVLLQVRIRIHYQLEFTTFQLISSAQTRMQPVLISHTAPNSRLEIILLMQRLRYLVVLVNSDSWALLIQCEGKRWIHKGEYQELTEEPVCKADGNNAFFHIDNEKIQGGICFTDCEISSIFCWNAFWTAQITARIIQNWTIQTAKKKIVKMISITAMI